MRNLLWQSDAWKEYESLQAEKLTLKKVNKLLKDIILASRCSQLPG